MNSATKNIDVDAVRSDTVGCRDGQIHLNSAGAALPARPVAAGMIDHLRREEEIGAYEAADERVAEISRPYHALATLINAKTSEIAIVDNATRAWQLAFHSFRLRPGDRVLTAVAEYASNAISMLQAARRWGLQIDVVPDDPDGQLSVDALRSMIDDRVRLIAVTHVPSQHGLVNPAAEIGAVARSAGIPYLLDACQSVGQMTLDVEEIGCDVLTGAGRKFLRGPRSTGFLYCSTALASTLEPPFLDLYSATMVSAGDYEIRPAARRFESWESFSAAKIGLGIAADYAISIGVDLIERRVRELADGLRERLRTVQGVTVHDRGRRRCGIVSFTVAGHSAEDVTRSLAAGNIKVWLALADSAPWDFERNKLPPMVRSSVHYYNTDQELDELCAALPR